MYFVPQPSTCTKCGHKGEYSLDNAPRGMAGPEGNRHVICPVCFEAMALLFCGLMVDDVSAQTTKPSARVFVIRPGVGLIEIGDGSVAQPGQVYRVDPETEPEMIGHFERLASERKAVDLDAAMRLADALALI